MLASTVSPLIDGAAHHAADAAVDPGSFSIKDRVKTYMVLFFLLEMACWAFPDAGPAAVFVFWEFGLIPMYFLINPVG